MCALLRTSDVILGGTFQVGEWDPVVDPEISKRIMDDCSEIVPSLRVKIININITCLDVAFFPVLVRFTLVNFWKILF